MSHLVLLGDSILDNAAYTAGGPAVISHLRESLPSHWQASLLAVDGSITADVINQLQQLPSDTTHIVISAGGNNAILQSGFVAEAATSVADALQRMDAIAQQFANEYRAMLAAAQKRRLPLVVCTIYDPNFADPTTQMLMRTGVILFNDVILHAAFQAAIPVLDLRQVCTTSDDFANEIEPSVTGGKKIAQAIVHCIDSHDFTQQRTSIYR